jgi:hypothetical protein
MAKQKKQSQLVEFLDNGIICDYDEINTCRDSFEFQKICDEVDRILLEFRFLEITLAALSTDGMRITIIMEDVEQTVYLTCNYFSKRFQVIDRLKQMDIRGIYVGSLQDEINSTVKSWEESNRV